MVRHETARQDPHRNAVARLSEQFAEGVIIPVAMEDFSSRVASIDDVVTIAAH